MHLHDRAGTLASIYITLKSCLSVHLTVTLISQPCLQRLKWDLLEMKAESSGTSKYIFISVNVSAFIHMIALKPMV